MRLKLNSSQVQTLIVLLQSAIESTRIVHEREKYRRVLTAISINWQAYKDSRYV